MAKAGWGIGLIVLGVGILVLTRQKVWSRVEPSMMAPSWWLDRRLQRKQSSSLGIRISIGFFGCVSIVLGISGFVSLISN